jgi:hypothetical protein
MEPAINKYLQIAIPAFHFDFGKTIVANASTTPYSECNTFCSYAILLDSLKPYNIIFFLGATCATSEGNK